MSSTILTVIVLVVMWLVVLVPMLVRRGEDASAADLADEGGTDTAESDETVEPTDAESAEPSAPARVSTLVRRRRALAVLIGLTTLTLLVAALTHGEPSAWVAQSICDILLVGYVIGLRRARVRHAVLLARTAAARTREAGRETLDPPVRVQPQRPAALRRVRARRYEWVGEYDDEYPPQRAVGD